MDDNVRGRRQLPVVRLLAAALAVVLVGVVVGCSRESTSVQPPRTQPEGPQTVRIGLLLPETGPAAASGVATRTLLEQRLIEINAELDLLGSPYTFAFETADTRSDPAVAHDRLDELAEDGVKLFIGPFSDAEVKAVRRRASGAGVLVASPQSAAISLAVSDNVLRFVPDDRVQAAAVVDLMRREGIETIAPVGRDDPTNAELLGAVGVDFTALGGGVTEPVVYVPSATGYGGVVETLAGEVAGAIEVVGAENASSIGVVLAGEEEVPQILTLAGSTPPLGEVRWFGRGFTRDPAVVVNPSSAAFAAAVGLVAATFGLDPATEDRWGPLVPQVFEETGVAPGPVAFAAYDALDVLVDAVVALGFPATEATSAEVRALRTEVISQSLTAEGVTGPLKLNEFGDRTTGVYDFWSVCAGPTDYEWRRTAVWTPGPDGLSGGTVTGPAAC